MCKYGYVRVSTKQQKTQRQIDSIKSFDTDAIIYEEKQSGNYTENRAVFRKLLNKVKSGDTIIFDEVFRMSRNADEGYNLYMELMEKNITLVFLRERHIDTEEYKCRTQNHIARVSSNADHIKKVIREQSKDFDGKFSNTKIMREYLQGIARNTYYKYKRELKAELALF